MEGTRDAIAAANDRFMEAFGHQDADAIAELYTDDARLLPPGSPAVAGKADIRPFWTNVMGMGIREAKLETETIEADGGLACEVGRFTLSGDNDISMTGKYVVVWKNRNGWKLHIDIWNADE